MRLSCGMSDRFQSHRWEMWVLYWPRNFQESAGKMRPFCSVPTGFSLTAGNVGFVLAATFRKVPGKCDLFAACRTDFKTSLTAENRRFWTGNDFQESAGKMRLLCGVSNRFQNKPHF